MNKTYSLEEFFNLAKLEELTSDYTKLDQKINPIVDENKALKAELEQTKQKLLLEETISASAKQQNEKMKTLLTKMLEGHGSSILYMWNEEIKSALHE